MKAPPSETFEQANILRKVRCLLLDIDGTIMLGKERTPGAETLFEAIEHSGRNFLVVTNNNSISVAEHAERLRGAGLTVAAQNILSSAEVAAQFLKTEWKCTSVMVLGARALRDALLEKGLKLTDENPDCVVVGFDTELCYERLKAACLRLSEVVSGWRRIRTWLCRRRRAFGRTAGQSLRLFVRPPGKNRTWSWESRANTWDSRQSGGAVLRQSR